MAVENIVAEDQRRIVIAKKILADVKRLRKPVG